ncbi:MULTISPECIES: hypothetical protein [Streptosporangium]|uniref:Ribosomal protein L40E n=1 Tax=Streptosporangium brasiliense TaxID=47480 RepID=A0ABT9R486_9ACTN|nr:hypothetical protein [Streptosporangium brasiliense]MDP9864032.1 ribosomal protein L40E [Streptosporangium brasiliense]
MGRFQCLDCATEHHGATWCPRCRTARAQVEICRSHGARSVARCGTCRILIRSQSGL